MLVVSWVQYIGMLPRYCSRIKACSFERNSSTDLDVAGVIRTGPPLVPLVRDVPARGIVERGGQRLRHDLFRLHLVGHISL